MAQHPPQIPFTPQTDPRRFPTWVENAPPGESGAPYPKMLTRLCTREDQEAWVAANKRIDHATKEPFWLDVPPRIGAPIPIVTSEEMATAGLCDKVGEPVIVADAEEEIRTRAFLGLDAPPPTSTGVAIPIRASEAEAPKPKRRRRIRKAAA